MATSDSGFVLVVSSAPLNGFASSAGTRGRTGELVVLMDDFRGTFTLQRWSANDSGKTIGTVPRSAAAQAGTLTIPSIAVSPAGQIAVLRDPNDYRIVVLSPAGETVTAIVGDIPRIKRTIRPPSDELKPHVSIDGLRVDDSGRLWARTMRGNESSTVLDLFAPDGKYLGEVVPVVIGTFSIAGASAGDWFLLELRPTAKDRVLFGMLIALASPRVASSLDDGLERSERLMAEAAKQSARIVCFPEAYLPGLRGQDFDVVHWGEDEERRTLSAIADMARRHQIAVIFGLERLAATGRVISACVIDAGGKVLGFQDKTQLDPSEDNFYVPGDSRRLFEVDGVKVGVVICHEGWRYPETVRWAASRGAKIVFHPQHTGNETRGMTLTEWGGASNPYYEKAMMMRSIENAIWFASVNYALRYPEAATSIIDPSGRCHAFLPYGEEGVLVRDIDLSAATGHLAARFAPDRYRESTE